MLGLCGVACGRIGFDDLNAGAPVIASPPTALASVSVGDDAACVLRESGELYCWGPNYEGAVGVGNYDPHVTPMYVGAGWRRVDVGASHTCALDEEGATWCWGGNSCCSTLGDGGYDNQPVPIRVAIPGVAIHLATGGYAAHAITGNGTRWAWGDNRTSGDLGIGSDEGPIGFPTAGVGPKLTMISAGYDHGCGIGVDGELLCWGENEQGKLGTGDMESVFAPTPVIPERAFTGVASGVYHSCAIRTDGELMCWGLRASGALGDSMTTGAALTPQPVMTDRYWRAVSAGGQSTCAIDTDDGLWCFGQNNAGQLGVGDGTARSVPTQVQPGTRWLAVDVSQNADLTCGLQTDRSVWCWGNNSDGQLGLGDMNNRSVPTKLTLPL